MQKPRILFIVESVTLAHFARSYLLAESLAKQNYEVHFASGDEFSKHFSFHREIKFHSISTLSSVAFVKRLENGTQLFSHKALESYVLADRTLLETIRPDIVLGDFRLTLGISAKLCQVPYINLCNAYWSEQFKGFQEVVPDHPSVRILGPGGARMLLKIIRPLTVKAILLPINRVRRGYGFSPFNDLFSFFLHGDYRFFLDPPEIFPNHKVQANEFFIGPPLWSPEGELNQEVKNLNSHWPKVYLALGSSTPKRILGHLLPQLKKLPFSFLISGQPRAERGFASPNCLIWDYLNGSWACRWADIMVSNGGVASYQALSEGKPVLGVCSNTDQFLCAMNIHRAELGNYVRADTLNGKILEKSLNEILQDEKIRLKAFNSQKWFGSYENSFIDTIDRILGYRTNSKAAI